MSKEALKLALEALEKISRTQYHIETPPVESLEEQMRCIADKAITAIKQALEQPVQDEFDIRGMLAAKLTCWHRLRETEENELVALVAGLTQPAPAQEPVAMRMPKVGDRVVCIDDESFGTVVYLTAGGSPEIKFDDGSHGTYMLREFADLFGYTTLPAASVQPTKDVEISNMGKPFTVKAYVTPTAAQPAPVQEHVEFGIHDKKMMFKVGVQQFTLDYEPDTQDEFNFMREMLIHAFSTFTHGVKTTQPAAQRPWVGLTNEERTKIRHEHYARTLPLMEAVEAKLHGKNT
jgi:hypothetical protein